jgi:hypothetical protein
MLDIFKNEILNKYANEYFLMFFNEVDEEIELDGYTSALMDIFPEHLVNAELKKCKKIYKELYSWVIDEFRHNDFRPIHEYVLYRMLENQLEIEMDLEMEIDKTKENEELKSLKNLTEEEIEYSKNVNNAGFYLNYFFEDNDFIHYKDYYDTFGSVLWKQMGYDNRIIELLPRDKRKELKEKLKKSAGNNT